MEGIGANGKAIEMTPEQAAIVGLVRRPEQLSPGGTVVRVIAAAGSGKTTLLESMARALSNAGHAQVTYLTFNRSAVADATKRLRGAADCSTLHGMAFRQMGVAEDGCRLIDERELDKHVLRECEAELDHLMRNAPAGAAHVSSVNAVRKQLAMFIRKTVLTFQNSKKTVAEGFDPRVFGTTYFPAKLWHEKPSKRPHWVPVQFGDFYTRCAKKMWEVLTSEDPGAGPRFTMYDTVMKRAQLTKAAIPGSALLLDESQDMNECQITWLAEQRHGKFVVFVGDMVQTIYSFRGAKSKYLRELKVDHDLTLTRSFRFGPGIAHVANTVLLAKEKSDQKDWLPYRLVGGGAAHGVLLRGGSAAAEGLFPRTILARANITLLKKALALLVQRPGTRFCINGKGQSGRNLWLKVLKDIDQVFALFKKTSSRLKGIYGFDDDEDISYEAFVDAVMQREITQLAPLVALVNEFKDDTLDQIAHFKEQVLDQDIAPHEADVVLSTVHAAKGMEWDAVEVCDDFLSLALYHQIDTRGKSGFGNARLLGAGVPSRGYNFWFKSYGDDVNLYYVAVTRPKKALVLPQRFLDLVDSMRSIRDTAQLITNGGGTVPAAAAADGTYFFPPFTTRKEAMKPAVGQFDQADSQLFTAQQVIGLDKSVVAPWLQERGGQWLQIGGDVKEEEGDGDGDDEEGEDEFLRSLHVAKKEPAVKDEDEDVEEEEFQRILKEEMATKGGEPDDLLGMIITAEDKAVKTEDVKQDKALGKKQQQKKKKKQKSVKRERQQAKVEVKTEPVRRSKRQRKAPAK